MDRPMEPDLVLIPTATNGRTWGDMHTDLGYHPDLAADLDYDPDSPEPPEPPSEDEPSPPRNVQEDSAQDDMDCDTNHDTRSYGMSPGSPAKSSDHSPTPERGERHSNPPYWVHTYGYGAIRRPKQD